MINKTCKQCSREFIVEDEDLSFYKKISPTFAGKSYEISSPNLCPVCREQRRKVARNVKNIYKRKCDLCGKESISIYSPDKTDIKVYCRDCWWSDKWDQLSYGQDFDFSRPFFEQFAELKKKVPAANLMNVKSENSEFTNGADSNKNCYLLFLAGFDEDVYYGYFVDNCKSCLDLAFVNYSELCYELVGSERNYNVKWGKDCYDCRDSYFIDDCQNCDNCIMCSGLRHKSFYYKNKQVSKDEYSKIERELIGNLGENIKKLKAEFEEIAASSPKKFAITFNSENCSGDHLYHSKNCYHCFDMVGCEDCQYSSGMFTTKDSYDVTGFGNPSERIYEATNVGLGSQRSSFINFAYELSDSLYCEHCYYSSNLFGCIGLRGHKQYCILNKQYTKEEYEALVPKIIEHMKQAGEWGEFFPYGLSAFGYNESDAMDFFPLKKEEAQELGAKWMEENHDIKFSGEPYIPSENISEYSQDEKKRNEILSGILSCEETGRPYKITPHELLFYIKHNIPIPRKHYQTRFLERLNKRNANKLYHRQCMNEGPSSAKATDGRCPNEFETTYAPDRKEQVYCEQCYQKSVI